MPADAVIAPLADDDVDRLVAVVDTALPASGPPEPPGSRHARIGRRLRGALRTDPEGAWVAREGDEPVGVALALRSGGVWVLSLLAVSPRAQSGGLGRALLREALRCADGCRGAMIAASQDPRAMRAYFRAGFHLHPTVAAAGPVDRAALPTGLDALVRAASVVEIERTVPIDEAVRGGGRPDHLAAFLETPGVQLFLAGGRGYAIGREGRLLGLAARDEEAARALLWRVLADTPDDEAAATWHDSVRARHDLSANAAREGIGDDEQPAASASCERITAGQDWAIDVALRAGLSLRTDGPIFTRGKLGTLRPFLPTGAYL